MSKGENDLKTQLNILKILYATQYRFDGKRKFMFDFILLPHDKKIAIEIDGGNWLVKKDRIGRAVPVGRHTKDSDYEKLNLAAMKGWRVLRYSPAMVKSGKAISDIVEILRDKSNGFSHFLDKVEL